MSAIRGFNAISKPCMQFMSRPKSLCEWIASANAGAHSEAGRATKHKPANEEEARKRGCDVHVRTAPTQTRIMRDRRCRNHAHARDVPIRDTEKQEDKEEQYVGTYEGRDRSGS